MIGRPRSRVAAAIPTLEIWIQGQSASVTIYDSLLWAMIGKDVHTWKRCSYSGRIEFEESRLLIQYVVRDAAVDPPIRSKSLLPAFFAQPRGLSCHYATSLHFFHSRRHLATYPPYLHTSSFDIGRVRPRLYRFFLAFSLLLLLLSLAHLDRFVMVSKPHQTVSRRKSTETLDNPLLWRTGTSLSHPISSPSLTNVIEQMPT